jgi:hypothetical protein
MSIARRLQNLERTAGGGDECPSCGWPTPADKWPGVEWHLARADAGAPVLGPIDLDATAPMPEPSRCPTCGRAFNFRAITLAGDKTTVEGA